MNATNVLLGASAVLRENGFARREYQAYGKPYWVDVKGRVAIFLMHTKRGPLVVLHDVWGFRADVLSMPVARRTSPSGIQNLVMRAIAESR
jgi:hypothetical protein